MATVKELLKNPGPVITALLPTLQELVANGDPFQANEVAKAIFDKQKVWGGGTVYERISQYPNRMSDPLVRDRFNTTLVKNFLYKLNNIPMGESNSWLEFQKFVDLFYQMVDPIIPFTRIGEFDSICCPECGCFTERIGLYKRPTVAGQGTGFGLYQKSSGSVSTPGETVVDFSSVDNSVCCPDNCGCYNERYFVLYESTLDKLVVWFNDGTGVQPVVSGAGTVNYVEVDISSVTSAKEFKLATDAAIDADGTYSATNEACCPPLNCNCLDLFSQYVNSANTRVSDVEDGKDGYETVVTTMRASDNTVIATGLTTDLAWQNAHNDLRVPYEEQTFGDRYMYLKSIGDIGDNSSKPCCESGNPKAPDPCIACFYFLQTPGIAILDEIPVNKPGVINNNTEGNDRLPVTT